MNQITIKKVGAYPHHALYQATDGKTTIPYDVELIRDGIGRLYVLECSQCGYFDAYSLRQVHNKIKGLFHTLK